MFNAPEPVRLIVPAVLAMLFTLALVTVPPSMLTIPIEEFSIAMPPIEDTDIVVLLPCMFRVPLAALCIAIAPLGASTLPLASIVTKALPSLRIALPLEDVFLTTPPDTVRALAFVTLARSIVA
jgi:hypothetical protein